MALLASLDRDQVNLEENQHLKTGVEPFVWS